MNNVNGVNSNSNKQINFTKTGVKTKMSFNKEHNEFQIKNTINKNNNDESYEMIQYQEFTPSFEMKSRKNSLTVDIDKLI